MKCNKGNKVGDLTEGAKKLMVIYDKVNCRTLTSVRTRQKAISKRDSRRQEARKLNTSNMRWKLSGGDNRRQATSQETKLVKKPVVGG